MAGVGYGPYKLVEYTPGEKLVVERYEDYYMGPANYKTIEYRIMPDSTAQEVALLNGEIDYFPVTDAETLAKYEADSNYDVHSFTEGRINYMQLNQNSDIFADSKAREVICKALNIDEIVAGAYGSEELARAATGTVICALRRVPAQLPAGCGDRPGLPASGGGGLERDLGDRPGGGPQARGRLHRSGGGL